MKGRTAEIIPGLSLVKNEMTAVENLLHAESRSEVRLVMEVSEHILGSGGKRFRPLLTLLCGQLVGLRRKQELCAYAAAMELCHTSTLLHDDVIDEAELRRGQVSANRRFGNAPSIIIGDYLLAKSFQLLLRGEKPAVMRLVSWVAEQMAEGEAYQLSMKQRVDLSEKEYERIIRAKTALLIQTSCQLPAVAAGVPPKMERALARFGYSLGLAFQIVDDILDYSASERQWGKQVGKDFLEGKTTLPVILAYHLASATEQKFLRQVFKKPERTAAEFHEVVTLLQRHAALDQARLRATAHCEKAKKELAVFPHRPVRAALLELADFVVKRRI